MTQKISRKDEETIPQFHSHEEARKWFKEKYGNDFMLTDVEEIGEETCYFYVLILDRSEHEKGQLELKEKGYLVGTEFLNSYQSIEIMESGFVHIVH